ncbi:MAG: MFS transporter [Kitasatospora sp.]|nr:MFS transporter [Kitasatospora sp.]
MSAPVTAPPGPVRPGPPAPDPLRWWALAVIAAAQLTVLLDGTIVNIALPSAQRDLGLGDGSRQWIVTAYTLALGGLLLLGGRVVDVVGRKRAFVTGLIGFAAASALGGAATVPAALLAARAAQGAFAALLTPAAISLVVATFTEPGERGRAFGVLGAISGAGSAGGLIAGGLLTEYLDWRWCMYVNVPIALAAVAAGLRVLRDPGGRGPVRLDVPGALLGCGGLTVLVLGFARAEDSGWTSLPVGAAFAAGAVLLALFALRQTRAAHPLVPPRLVRDRARAGALAVAALGMVGVFGLLLFLTYYLQVVRGDSAVAAGVSILPLTVGMTAGVMLGARLAGRLAPCRTVVPGLLVAAAGVALLALVDTGSSYPAQVLPALLLAGLGMGSTSMTCMVVATAMVAPADSGAASALYTTAQQIGGSVGTAVLNTVAAEAAARHLAAGADRAQSTVYGFTTALWGVAVLLVLTALGTGLLVGGPLRRTAAARTP